jgi:hypothetical protein
MDAGDRDKCGLQARKVRSEGEAKDILLDCESERDFLRLVRRYVGGRAAGRNR